MEWPSAHRVACAENKVTLRETRAMLDAEWYKFQPARVKEPCCVLSIAARSGVREFTDPARQLPRPVRELSKSVQWFLAWSGSFRKLQDMVRGAGGQFCETTHPCVCVSQSACMFARGSLLCLCPHWCVLLRLHLQCSAFQRSTVHFCTVQYISTAPYSTIQ